MVDVAGLVLGVATLWKTSVEIFDVIDCGKKYGFDYEILRAKLEVERLRLLAWGESVGLNSVDQGGTTVHIKLQQEAVRKTVLELLGAIQHCFEQSSRLQDRYGLQPVLEEHDNTLSLVSPNKSGLPFESLFRRAYQNLRLNANERQVHASIVKKAAWAIHDKKKFQTMVVTIKGLNDSLQNLFPGIDYKTMAFINDKINQIDDPPPLKLLREATTSDYEDISETASIRLDTLETSSAIYRPIKGHRDIIKEYNRGGLVITIMSSSDPTKAFALVFWSGERYSYGAAESKSLVKTIHPAFDTYRRKRFIKRRGSDPDNYGTQEDYIRFDVESDPRYEHIHPGTVTVEGLALEARDYEENHHQYEGRNDVSTLQHICPIPSWRLVNHILHLQGAIPSLNDGFEPGIGIEELFDSSEYSEGDFDDATTTILHLYSHLNNIKSLTDFTLHSGVFQIGIPFRDFLYQIVLANKLVKELSNNLSAPISGLTPHVLASLIIQDQWLSNVQLSKGPHISSREAVASPSEVTSTAFEEGNDAEVTTASSIFAGAVPIPSYQSTGTGLSDPEEKGITREYIEADSKVIEQQMDGLLAFAKHMEWEYLDETREFSEQASWKYKDFFQSSGLATDWSYGLTLPGKWMSFKIMATLIHSSPSTRQLGPAQDYEDGVSLPAKSYFRIRTVLGRVLGCHPGCKSICGWIGPCPPINFISSQPVSASVEARYIRLKARKIPPLRYPPRTSEKAVDQTYYHYQFMFMGQQPDEETSEYMKSIHDPNQWITPQPPFRQSSIIAMKSVNLENIPAEDSHQALVESTTEYQSSITFEVDGSLVTYTLLTNPVFISPPACRPGPHGEQHKVHFRELHRFSRQHVYNVTRLGEYLGTPSEEDAIDIMVINATGTGDAEMLARSWCAERGKNAVIRKAGGPCYTCAVRAASKGALGTGVLIWVS
ncbi:HeLo domain-containing protein [Trichophyton interdigitale]|nr:HeLo domain-containing protein [Trichophyton interdigitale]KAG5217418.1 HeLo domain-containing protein [Trichophyton interdigitale]KAG8209275.1 HeLo domain-containing protein [Trichophyton interdigitale]